MTAALSTKCIVSVAIRCISNGETLELGLVVVAFQESTLLVIQLTLIFACSVVHSPFWLYLSAPVNIYIRTELSNNFIEWQWCLISFIEVNKVVKKLYIQFVSITLCSEIKCCLTLFSKMTQIVYLLHETVAACSQANQDFPSCLDRLYRVL